MVGRLIGLAIVGMMFLIGSYSEKLLLSITLIITVLSATFLIVFLPRAIKQLFKDILGIEEEK